MIFLSWKCDGGGGGGGEGRRKSKPSLKTSYTDTKINNVLKCNLP